MSLSGFLHNREYIGKVAALDFAEGQRFFGDLALRYLCEHDAYYALIRDNLTYFGLPCDRDAVESAVKHIGYHYHEKFLSFVKTPEFYPSFHERIIKPDSAVEEVLRLQREKKATVILSTHFGGMALLPGVLNYCKIDLSSIIRFPSEEFKQLMMSKHLSIVETLGYGRTKFVEVDKQPIMELAFGLQDGETFFSVLDEHTPFNVDVSFLGRTISGGAGIDKIIDFIGKDQLELYFAVMVRVESNYRVDLHRIALDNPGYIQKMFDIYETYVVGHCEQWFFLQEVHENMPEQA